MLLSFQKVLVFVISKMLKLLTQVILIKSEFYKMFVNAFGIYGVGSGRITHRLTAAGSRELFFETSRFFHAVSP